MVVMRMGEDEHVDAPKADARKSLPDRQRVGPCIHQHGAPSVLHEYRVPLPHIENRDGCALRRRRPEREQERTAHEHRYEAAGRGGAQRARPDDPDRDSRPRYRCGHPESARERDSGARECGHDGSDPGRERQHHRSQAQQELADERHDRDDDRTRESRQHGDRDQSTRYRIGHWRHDGQHAEGRGDHRHGRELRHCGQAERSGEHAHTRREPRSHPLGAERTEQ